MALEFHGAGTASIVGGTTDATPTLPASMAAGYLSIMMLYSRAIDDHVPPAGWTEFIDISGNSNRIKFFYRTFVGGDTNPTITHDATAAAGATYAVRIFAYKSNSGGTVTVRAATAGNTGAVAEDIGPMTGIDALSGEFVCVGGGRRDDATSIATLTTDGLTWNERWDEASVVGNDLHVGFQDALTAADTGVAAKTLDVTLAAGGTQEWAGGVFVINDSSVISFIPKIMVI